MTHSMTHNMRTRMPNRDSNQQLWPHPEEQRSQTQLRSLGRRQGKAANLMYLPWPDGGTNRRETQGVGRGKAAPT